MPRSVDDFNQKIAKLRTRLDTAKIVIEDSARTKRQVTVNIQHIERFITSIEGYRTYTSTVEELTVQEFDYDSASDILEEAEESLIELRAWLQEMEEAAATPAGSTISDLPAVVKSGPCNIKMTIPKFTGDYQAYPKFKAAFEIAMTADGKSKAEQLRVLEQHLEGRPLTLIANLPPTDEGMQDAMGILDETFNVPERQKQAILQKIKRLPQADDELVNIRSNYEEMESLLRALQKYEDVNQNEELRRIVMSKYSPMTLDRVSPTEVPTLKVVRGRIKQIVRAKEDISMVFESMAIPPTSAPHIPIAAFPVRVQGPATTRNQVVYSTPRNSMQNSANSHQSKASNAANQTGCAFCQGRSHESESCSTYPDAATRVRSLQSFTCHACLQQGHLRRNCQNFKSCVFCGNEWHHSALCPTKFGYFREHSSRNRHGQRYKEPEPPLAEPEKKEIQVKTTVGILNESSSSYLTARARIRNPINGSSTEVRVFLDCGSNKTFILHRVANDLQLKPIETSELAISVFMRPEIEQIRSEVVNLEIVDAETNRAYPLTAHTVPALAGEIATIKANDIRVKYPQIKHMNLADEANKEEIAVLIGNNFLWKFILPEQKIELTDSLYLINTLFGWMVVGNSESEQRNSVNRVHSMHVSTKFVTALWSLDAIGITDRNYTQSEEEEIAVKQFNETIRYIPEEKRYEVGLPSRTLHPEIPSNYALAKAVLMNLLKRYEKKPKYLQACDEIFKQQREAGIIEEVPWTSRKERIHYLPFHFIEREGKSTPIRVVYNGSAKSTKSQLSLNETLYKGVNLLNDMIDVLVRFRLRAVALISDIEKAFHQITLIPEHRDYVRFLWKKEPMNKDCQEMISYRFRRIPFGIISSPFILAATILHHLNRYESRTAQRIRNDIYADNVITTFSTVESALEFYKESMEIFSSAGMPLRQWQSNSKQLLHEIPSEYCDKRDVITILGLIWDTEKDVIRLAVPEPMREETAITMLRVLQRSSQIYDPCGFFAPVTIRSRMFLRKLHSRDYRWETELNEDERNEWSEIESDLLATDEFEFRRSFGQSTTENYQLHVFTDASKDAYAAVAYLRNSAETTTTHMVLAKSRVTPLQGENRLTIPRLELLAALLGSRLMKKVSAALKNENVTHKYQWSDSKCVLSWLRTNAGLPLFVRNRVTEIKQLADVQHRYVPSEQNPADDASRGVRTADLHDPETTWWRGPEWLRREEEYWPTMDSTYCDIDSESQPVSEVILAVPEKINIGTPFEIKHENYVEYVKLIRVTAIVVQFIRLFRVSRRKKLFPVSKETSVEWALILWVRYAQQSAFETTHKLLQQKKTSSLIKKFKLFLDDHDIIRLQGRFHHAPVPWEEKHPALLPKPREEHFTKLLVLEFHRKRLHAGVNATLSAVREKFWVLQGRKQISAIIKQCNACRRERAKPYQQPTDSILPKIRLDSAQEPFFHVGLDIAGHFWVRQAKRWILLVTCLVTRAVIIEDLENMEAETIMCALERAGTHTRTYLSDNAPQFMTVKSVLASRNTEPIVWKFIPAQMPWAGGAYERLVKIIKTSFYATFREMITVSETQFRTLLKKIADVINNRPLTYLGEQFDGQPLTPNHLLKRRFVTDDRTVDILKTDTECVSFLKHQLKQTNEMINQFWHIWAHEYLQFLRERNEKSKFRQDTYRSEPRIGDVVLLHDEVQKRRNWNLGIIVQLQRSEDNAVRSAVVKLAKGTRVVRPVQKLYYMELNEFNDQVPATSDDNHDIENIIIN